MFRVFTCLTDNHDWRLVVVAGIVCFIASLCAVSLFHRALSSQRRARTAWVLTASLATGFGIWATHFIAMLAYDPGVGVAYDIGLTALSLATAVAITYGGLCTAIYMPGRWAAAIGGGIVGAGVAAMHYLGMSALELPGRITWSMDLVLASVVIGVLFGVTALSIAVRRDTILNTSTAALVLTLAIVSHHFTAMGAVEIVPDPTRVISTLSIAPLGLALGIANAALTVLGMSIVASLMDRRLREQSAQTVAALENIPHGLIMFDAAERIVVCNDRYVAMYNLPREVVERGSALIELLRCRHAAGALDQEPEQLRTKILSGIAQESGANFSFEMTDGRTISISTRRMADGGWVATHEDITERRRAEAEIAFMARHDALTNLPNRRQLNEQLEEALERSKSDENVAVLCLDLDRFKSVNDTLGHPIGDMLLNIAAERLRNCVRITDVVARLGGDEFAVVQVGGAQPNEATALAARIIDSISAPYEVAGHQLVVGMSVGIAIASTDGMCAAELLKNADMALYRAKADGRGIYRFFEPEMDARMQARRSLELDLRKALVSSQFELFYQPLITARTEWVHGFEALIRWNHPERGMIPPAEFIPLAEETGLIVPLGEWILREACQEALNWPEHLGVAVNLSAVQFKNKQLFSTIVNTLETSGLSPNRLELEITETVLLQDSDGTLDTLHQLRDLGIKISMDDFGTGYSSLGYLRKFPFDKIKIDHSFIHDMRTKDDSLAIVRAVVAIGASLGINTTAEGVETAEQFERLRQEGCTEVQGYLFSPPRPAAEIRNLIASLSPKLKAIA